MTDWNQKTVSATPAPGVSTIHRAMKGAPVAMAAALELTFEKTLYVDVTDPLRLVNTSGALNMVGVWNQDWQVAFFSAPADQVKALHVNYFRRMDGMQFRYTGYQGGALYPNPVPAPTWKYLGNQSTDDLLWESAENGGLCRWKLDRANWANPVYFQGRGEVTTTRKWDEVIPLDESRAAHWFALDVDWEHAGHGDTKPDPAMHAARENFAVGVDSRWVFNFWGDRGQEP
jgi:hypothetical protein